MDCLRCVVRVLPGDGKAWKARRSLQGCGLTFRRSKISPREGLLEETGRRRVAASLGIERNVAAASAAVFLVGLGEELWKKFLPKHLESLGASVGVVGLFGTSEDFLDALYQYPGGWLADYWGRRRAFLTFLVAALTGYLVYLFSPSWPFLFLGLAFVMAWQSMASPALFATSGASLPPSRRAMGFTVQSLLKRIPMVVSPLLGGAMIGATEKGRNHHGDALEQRLNREAHRTSGRGKRIADGCEDGRRGHGLPRHNKSQPEKEKGPGGTE